MSLFHRPADASAFPDSAPRPAPDPPPTTRRLRLIRILCLLGLALSTVVALVIAMYGPMKDDIAWLLYVASGWLHGSRLYIDIVEVNPPLIVWLSAIPVFAGERLGLDSGLLAMPFFGSIVLGCGIWAGAIITRGRTRIGDPVVVCSIVGALLVLIPSIEFGQREHLLFACALPYLAVAARELMRDPPRRSVAIAAGIVAALGCALKPRYVLAFGAVEIYCLIQGLRLLRPANIAAALTLAAYGVAVWVLEPAFFRDAVPMAFALYGVSDVPLINLLLDCRLLLVGIAAGAVLLATQPIRGDHGKVPAVLLIFAVATTLVCLIEGKEWFYHRIPATGAAIMCLMAWTAMRLRGPWRPGWRISGPVILASLVLVTFGLRAYERLSIQMNSAIGHDKTRVVRLEQLIRREHARSYMAFSDLLSLAFPVVNETRVVWASRFDSMWALDGELWRAEQDGAPPADFPIRRWVTADFRRACPDIVVIDRHSRLDYVALLSRADPAFKLLWQRYRRIAAFDGLIVFRRKPAPSPAALGLGPLNGCKIVPSLKG
jgi:hypothetical protein